MCYYTAGDRINTYNLPKRTALLFEEIIHIKHDANYDPSNFFYRLLRGEGKLHRDIQLSVWLLSNELPGVDLRLDSRVQSAMNDKQVFFPPYQSPDLAAVLRPRLERAFRDAALTDDVRSYGINMAAIRWGDAWKALTLFRRAGETANEQDCNELTRECIDENLEAADKEATIEKLLNLPVQHFFVLLSITGWTDRLSGEIVQPVTTEKVAESYNNYVGDESRVSQRAIREIITDLETMGLVETWIQSKGAEGRVKQIETAFEPEWVQEAKETYVKQSPNLEQSSS